jgi:hypothetical protein
MTDQPVICFGQQPCGFFPRRYLYAKIQTARRLQSQIGGEIVFFYHDSDHDPRETKTHLYNRKSGAPVQLNFAYDNRVLRKFTPLYLKRIAAGWQTTTAPQLTHYVARRWVDEFKAVTATTAADFCLEMYRRMGLLDGMRIARSSDPALRRSARDVAEFFVDVPYDGEIVRARHLGDSLQLHEGGSAYINLPMVSFTKEQISPTRDSRLVWMQSVLHCTHYIAGGGEQQYLRKEAAPEITFVARDTIERADDAYIEE